jgi:hypothetical protein
LKNLANAPYGFTAFGSEEALAASFSTFAFSITVGTSGAL